MEIITRSAWGSQMTVVQDKPGPLPKVYIHHTAGYFPNAVEEEVQQMHILQHVAIDSKGYSDIDYNWLVGPSGTVYEARGLNKKSAATLDENDVSRSICFMGNFQNVTPTQESIDVASELILYLIGHNNLVTPQVLQILGHRDNPKHPMATACPGNNLYPKLAEIRNKVVYYAPPVGEEGMLKSRFLRQKGYLNVFHVGNGYPALSVSEELMNSLLTEDPAIPKIFFDNMPAFHGMCMVAGIDPSDPTQAVPGGPTDRF
jgi:N-acetylmuramoyl-L-alanine amidase